MTDTIPRAASEAQAARARQCPLCPARPGVPCQAKPAGDHLARYLDAYTAGALSRAYMAAVVGELVVITRWRSRVASQSMASKRPAVSPTHGGAAASVAIASGAV